MDHNELTHRDDSNSHTIGAVSNLGHELASRPTHEEVLQLLRSYSTTDHAHPACSGSSTHRPSSPHQGFCYFDTTLGRPVWFTGAAWVDAYGNQV